jgi:hypothetical protein
MRSIIRVNHIAISLTIYVILFLNILIIAPGSVAQGNQLHLHITDDEGYPIDEIYEEEYFIISVYSFNESDIPEWKIDVDIEFNDIHYTIKETGEITIKAPKIDQDTSFVILASKEGYNSTNGTITILDNESQDEPLKLIIEPEVYTVDAGNQFSVLVKDEDGNTIPGAEVAIQSFGDIRITDDDGRAWLTAPEDEDSIKIIAQKDGYVQGDIDIMINILSPWWITLINSPYFPIIIAVIFLLFAIVFVSYRQKKSVYDRASKISQEKIFAKYDSDVKTTSSSPSKSKEKLDDRSSLKDAVRIQSQQEAKVEEIRISKPRKKKQVVPVKSQEDETEKVINRKKTQKRDYDWFEGTDDIRYEIDKLTGEIDEEGADKWYEGADTLKDKIDEKMKKKDTKKKNGD